MSSRNILSAAIALALCITVMDTMAGSKKKPFPPQPNNAFEATGVAVEATGRFADLYEGADKAALVAAGILSAGGPVGALAIDRPTNIMSWSGVPDQHVFAFQSSALAGPGNGSCKKITAVWPNVSSPAYNDIFFDTASNPITITPTVANAMIDIEFTSSLSIPPAVMPNNPTANDILSDAVVLYCTITQPASSVPPADTLPCYNTAGGPFLLRQDRYYSNGKPALPATSMTTSYHAFARATTTEPVKITIGLATIKNTNNTFACGSSLVVHAGSANVTPPP